MILIKKNDVKISETVEEGDAAASLIEIEPEDSEVEESNNLLDRAEMFFSGLIKEKDHIPEYVVKSFKELDEQSKRIIFAILAIFAIAILFKIFKLLL